MKRRWKVGIALAVVGIGGFLVWAFLSPATPPLTIRFLGYLTNGAPFLDQAFSPGTDSVLVVFAATNHSTHTMNVGALTLVELQGRIWDQGGGWLDTTNLGPGMGWRFTELEPGEGSRVATCFSTTNNPVSVTVGDYSSLVGNTWWDRVRRRLFGNLPPPHITATNELR